MVVSAKARTPVKGRGTAEVRVKAPELEQAQRRLLHTLELVAATKENKRKEHVETLADVILLVSTYDPKNSSRACLIMERAKKTPDGLPMMEEVTWLREVVSALEGRAKEDWTLWKIELLSGAISGREANRQVEELKPQLMKIRNVLVDFIRSNKQLIETNRRGRKQLQKFESMIREMDESWFYFPYTDSEIETVEKTLAWIPKSTPRYADADKALTFFKNFRKLQDMGMPPQDAFDLASK
ncbi:Uncharacterised protein [Candidatus Burarchaeum australiense]|nr:Uncharacterised protein [Candidatus Burarchaeum australiense]